jgi:acyl dehydratase
MKSVDFRFEDIHTGDTASFERIMTENDIQSFAQLSGDYNPLHMDQSYAATTKFGKCIVHGMFLGALCSNLVGMYMPGKRCLYLKQTLLFKKPVYINDTVNIKGTVISKSDSTKVLDIKIGIFCNGEEVVSGEALVQVMSQ